MDGRCNLCGRVGKLTEEHTPPRQAFNDRQVFWVSYKQANFGILPQARAMPEGFSRPVLCGKCNNDTGGSYGTEYVKFAQRLADPADQARVGETVVRDERTYPLRVIKQALMIIIATCSSLITDENPTLRHFLLNPEARGIPAGLRLYAFIPAIKGISKSTGRGTRVDLRDGKATVSRMAENSWWPIGWVLTFDNAPLPEALEVTDWGKSPFRPAEIVTLRLPVLWSAGMGPADFRSPEQLARERTDVVFGDFD